MIDMSMLSAGAIALILFGGAVVLMMTGLPIAFAMGSVTYILILLLRGPVGLGLIASRVWGGVDMFVLTCLPMFVFMGLMLERSGIAGQLYDMMHKWAGGLRGGLAAGTVFICMMMAAMTGMSAAATLTMGLSALPEMLKRNYNKSIALGCIGAGGALGTLIPPSVTMVFYAVVAQESIGKLFMGGIIPGIILSLFFIGYILIRSWLQPSAGPSLPVEERASWKDKFISIRQVILPVVLIVMVLGSIFAGIATPTEAAAIGALGTIICAAINRSLGWKNIKDTCMGTVRVCGMGLWILVGTICIQSVTYTVGAQEYIAELFTALPGGKWGALIAMQLIWFVMGCLIDPFGIIMITGPIFVPIMRGLDFSIVWFGIVFVVNMEMSYITPPYGINLFYLKGIVPPGVTMGDVYRSIGPFVALQALALVLIIVFPQLVLWLPGKMLTTGAG
jgi:tripartite ATP-independent transporter DctM subunit